MTQLAPTPPTPRPHRPLHRLAPWLACASAMLLAACATRVAYQPFEGADAARLRVRLLIPPGDKSWWNSNRVSSSASPRAVNGAVCGGALSVPSMWLYMGSTAAATTARAAQPATPGLPPGAMPGPIQYPRANMVGTTEPENSESMEFRLSPGLHVVDFANTRTQGNWMTTCASQVAMQLAPGRQYELAIGFTSEGRCVWESRRLEGQSFVPNPVVKSGKRGEICADNQYRS